MTAPIVIVSGIPRSGTSMMMRMLEAGGVPVLTDGIRAADQHNPHGYYEYERVKQLALDNSWLDEAQGKAVKVIYLLLYQLPPRYRYKVIFMTRRLSEVVASQDAMIAGLGKRIDSSGADQVAQALGKQLEELDGWLAKQPNFDVLRVDFNQTLGNPAGSIAAIGDLLDSDLDALAMRSVVDRALYRQRS